MARPKKDNADYFSHDADMRNDDRIKAVRKKFKSTGYAIYNMLLEYLTDKNFFRCDYNDMSFELMSGDFDEDPGLIKDVIDYCIHLGLLQQEQGFIRCKTLENRLEAVLLKRKHRKNEVPDAETTQSKVKESKVFDVIGEKTKNYFIIKSKYPKEKKKKVYDLEKYFTHTGQIENLKVVGWVHFGAFMEQNPAKIFNDDDHVYNTFRGFSENYNPPARAPNKFDNAEYYRTLWTKEAWEEKYAGEIKNNPEFRKYFGYGELPASTTVGVKN